MASADELSALSHRDNISTGRMAARTADRDVIPPLHHRCVTMDTERLTSGDGAEPPRHRICGVSLTTGHRALFIDARGSRHRFHRYVFGMSTQNLVTKKVDFAATF
ncbi:hypothetical protein J6590_092511 [Homalodisca vitripennis]|nr:hypothetical protein J6590_047257 [Homalodisca vitripennis]KAG8294892.1 hypothetical protein J6590_092511 [Homalodisca vitripennis]